MATQVATKRLYNIMSSGQALMRSVYYSRQASSSSLFMWNKQTEIFSMAGSASRRFATTVPSQSQSQSTKTAENSEASSPSSAPPAVEADAKSYGGVQEDHNKVAQSTHEQDSKKKDDQEKLANVGYDISKVSKPSGGE